MDSLSFDIATLAEAYAAGSIRPVEVIRETLNRISNGDPNIWIAVDSQENLLQQAEALEMRNQNELPLYGVPFAIKDNIDVSNLPTTAACPDFKRFPREDAYVVSLLRAAGAIPVGKTNLDQFATGLVGTRSPYGVPGNAFDPEYIPGGSSSGSAVSVALGQVSFSLGTDTAGSGRVPACYNNLVGLKPSRGALSANGVFPACRSLDCVSIFALNASDAQRVFRIAARFDPEDPYSRRQPSELDTAKKIAKPSLVFGVPRPNQLRFFGNESYQELYHEAIERLQSLGYSMQTIDFAPFLDAARLLYEGPWVAERLWAIKDLLETSPDSLHPITRQIVEGGYKPSAVDTFEAAYELQRLRKLADEQLVDLDFVATPTAGTHYRIQEIENDPISLNSNLGYYTNFMNLLDLSAIAVPTGFAESGMPFGITLFSEAFHDEKLLSVANRLHEASRIPLGKTSEKRFPQLKPVEYDATPIAVCGAHMRGLPLNRQLTDLGATFIRSTQTAARYRLFALPRTSPPKPGLARNEENGARIELEIWNLPNSQWAEFIRHIPSPLGIGTIELDDGSTVKGFLCESWATESAKDISELGNWRKYKPEG